MEKMLVTQGLNELKLLDSRINNEINKLEVAAVAKKSYDTITPNLTKADFVKTEKAKLQSILDLINRRYTIKSAIVLSNATTKLMIAGKEYTVAEAIEIKNSIGYKQGLVRRISYLYDDCKRNATLQNNRVEEHINDLVAKNYEKDSKVKISAEDYEAIANPYRKANEVEVVDPLDAVKTADTINDEVQAFLSEVDSALQISNCTTYIEF